MKKNIRRFVVKASRNARNHAKGRIIMAAEDYQLHLYEAFDNAQNYILIRDFSRDEDDTMIMDWDLSDSEVQDIVDRFNHGNYTEDDTNGDGEWITFDEARSMFNEINSLE